MSVKPNSFFHDLETLCDAKNPLQELNLDQLLSAVPRVDQLEFSPEVRTVLIRADLDVPLSEGKVVDATRLESCAKTVQYCVDRGLTVVLMGHLGRDPKLTFEPVVDALASVLSRDVTLIREWLDVETGMLTESLLESVNRAASGSILLLENVRRYPLEQALWKIKPDTLEINRQVIFSISEQMASQVSSVEINEAIAASNRDVSSSAMPLAMSQTGLGFFIHDELALHASRVVGADVLVFSGLKANKLDDLEGIVNQGHVRDLIVGGSLAMSLVKANAELAGTSISIGVAESDSTYIAYVDESRINQARRILETCQTSGTTVHLPSDYILDDGSTSSEIPFDRAQMDIGPDTRARFAEVIAAAGDEQVLFLNGVMGKVEDDRFVGGTKAIFDAVRRATSSGMQTYVGGGDGRAALFGLGYGDAVTHAFTAGGTILKLMSGRVIPYLLAMYLQNTRGE